MKDFATKYIEFYQKQSKLVKILLCLLWDIPSNLYRLSKSALKDSVLGIVLAILLAIFGGWILFVIDIVCLCIKDKIYWLDELGVDETKIFADDEPIVNDAKDDNGDGVDGTVEE